MCLAPEVTKSGASGYLRYYGMDPVVPAPEPQDMPPEIRADLVDIISDALVEQYLQDQSTVEQHSGKHI